MLSQRCRSLATTAARRNPVALQRQAIRAQSTKAAEGASSPIAKDGRHEVWREGIYDHDNEPK